MIGENSDIQADMAADFICVCQGGPLEMQAVLLIASLLENKKVDGEIIAAVPVGDHIQPISDTTDDFLKHHGVRLVLIENALDSSYPIAHKIMCFNIEHKHDCLIFMDSDMLLLTPFTPDFLVTYQDDFAGRLTDFSDLSRSEWATIYNYLDLDTPDCSYRSLASDDPIPLSFNSGLIVTRTASTLFQAWMKYARLLNDPARFPKTRPFLDQISLVFAVRTLNLGFDLLSQKEHRSSPIFPIDLVDPPLFCHYYENIHLLGDQVLVPFCRQLIDKYDHLGNILADDRDLCLLSGS